MKRRKVTVAVLSVVLAAAALTGCGSAQQTNGPKKTRVVLNEVAHSVFYAPMYVAIEEGYFEDAGIDLELVTGFGADKTMTAVLTGEADIGFMGSESTIYTYAGGTEDYVVNFAQLTQRAGNFLVAIEEGYFEDAGIDLELVTGFGADKTMTAVLTGEADIGFMGSESTIYTYAGGTEDYVVNFAQLTQRAGNFLVAREPIDDFSWDMLKGTTVLGGRAGGMPEMVFEYILEKNNMDPTTDLSIDQSIDFGSTAAAFSGGQGDFTIEFEPHATLLEQKGDGYVVASLGEESGYVPYTSFSAKKNYLEKNPETIQAFTDALQKGMDYVQEHSAEEIAKCIAPQFAETESDTLTAIVARYQEQDTWKEDLIFHKDAFDLLQNILEDSDVLKERVPYEALVTTEFAEKATAR